MLEYDVDIAPAKCCSAHGVFPGDIDCCPACRDEHDAGISELRIQAQPMNWHAIRKLQGTRYFGPAYIDWLRWCAKRAYDRYCVLKEEQANGA